MRGLPLLEVAESLTEIFLELVHAHCHGSVDILHGGIEFGLQKFVGPGFCGGPVVLHLLDYPFHFLEVGQELPQGQFLTSHLLEFAGTHLVRELGLDELHRGGLLRKALSHHTQHSFHGIGGLRVGLGGLRDLRVTEWAMVSLRLSS